MAVLSELNLGVRRDPNKLQVFDPYMQVCHMHMHRHTHMRMLRYLGAAAVYSN